MRKKNSTFTYYLVFNVKNVLEDECTKVEDERSFEDVCTGLHLHFCMFSC